MDIYKLIENHKWSKEKPSRNHKVTTVEFFKLCVELEQAQKVAEYLDVKTQTIARWLKGYEELPKGRMFPVNRVSGYFEHKQCNSCKEILPFECYYPSNDHCFKKHPWCKDCNRDNASDWRKNNPEKTKAGNRTWKQNNPEKNKYYSAKRRAAKIQRTPAWANQEKINEIYANCPEGYHVDHIVPLRGERVSGLHVENNLQYLPASENISKGNKFQVA